MNIGNPIPKKVLKVIVDMLYTWEKLYAKHINATPVSKWSLYDNATPLYVILLIRESLAQIF